MIARRPGQRFSLPARMLHWIVAAVIPVQIYLAWAAEWEDSRAESFLLIRSHYQLGVVIFSLMLLRILWRVGYGAPSGSEGEPRCQSSLAATVHWLLYALLLSMPISGYVIWVWMGVPMDVLGTVQLPKLFTPPMEDEMDLYRFCAGRLRA